MEDILWQELGILLVYPSPDIFNKNILNLNVLSDSYAGSGDGGIKMCRAELNSKLDFMKI